MAGNSHLTKQAKGAFMITVIAYIALMYSALMSLLILIDRITNR